MSRATLPALLALAVCSMVGARAEAQACPAIPPECPAGWPGNAPADVPRATWLDFEDQIFTPLQFAKDIVPATYAAQGVSSIVTDALANQANLFRPTAVFGLNLPNPEGTSGLTLLGA